MDNKNELFPIVNADGKVIGSITRGEAHNGSKVLHPVVHLHLFNTKGELYLQRRPAWKDVQPGKWDTACGGHIDYGETPITALKREVSEELGVIGFSPKLIDKYVYDSLTEKELVYVNTATYDGEVHPSISELDGGRFWTRKEIEENMGKDVFTPNFESEYRRFFTTEK
jgi:isopentenyldiphosphate isomerase